MAVSRKGNWEYFKALLSAVEDTFYEKVQGRYGLHWVPNPKYLAEIGSDLQAIAPPGETPLSEAIGLYTKSLPSLEKIADISTEASLMQSVYSWHTLLVHYIHDKEDAGWLMIRKYTLARDIETHAAKHAVELEGLIDHPPESDKPMWHLMRVAMIYEALTDKLIKCKGECE